jgi:negative regulator of flagellin synthesis FlgM
MKVTDKTTRDISGASGTASVAASKEKRRAGKSKETEPNTTDKVAISTRAKEAAKAKEVASSAPDVDEAKVARLKAAIEGGTYRVDADKVADRLVDEHLASSF